MFLAAALSVVGLFRAFPGVQVTQVLAAPSGEVVVVGTTTASKLPVTPDATQSDYLGSTCGTQIGPGFPNPIPCPNVYVARLAADGSMVYGSYIGAVGGLMPAGAALDSGGKLHLRTVPYPGLTLSRLGVDREGNEYAAAGSTVSRTGVWTAEVPGTVRDLAVSAEGRVYVLSSVLTVFDSSGRVLAQGDYPGSGDDARWVAAAPDGSIYVAGTTRYDRFPVTAGAMVTGFVVKLAQDLSTVWATYLGGESWDWLTGLAAMPDGSVVVVGSTSSRSFPITADAYEPCNETLGLTQTAGFASHLAADGRMLYSTYVNLGEFASAVLGVAAAPDGKAVLVGEPDPATNTVFGFDPDRAPERRRFCVANSASYSSGMVAPGQFATLFGERLTGPVLVNGAPAEVLYTSDRQINIWLPEDLAGDRAEIAAGDQSATVRVADSAPGLFRVIVNEDGSANSREHPAPRGSLVTIFGTGFGTKQRAHLYFGPNEAQGSQAHARGLDTFQVRVPDGPVGAVPVNYSIGVSFALGNVRVWVE